MSGIERKIDNLGRIVIPISYRKALGLKSEDSLTISLKKDEIIISAKKHVCAICGNAMDRAENMRVQKLYKGYKRKRERVIPFSFFIAIR